MSAMGRRPQLCTRMAPALHGPPRGFVPNCPGILWGRCCCETQDGDDVSLSQGSCLGTPRQLDPSDSMAPRAPATPSRSGLGLSEPETRPAGYGGNTGFIPVPGTVLSFPCHCALVFLLDTDFPSPGPASLNPERTLGGVVWSLSVEHFSTSNKRDLKCKHCY